MSTALCFKAPTAIQGIIPLPITFKMCTLGLGSNWGLIFVKLNHGYKKLNTQWNIDIFQQNINYVFGLTLKFTEIIELL